MSTYFTSDSHFYHRNVLNFEDRPFDSVEEMNNKLVESWNRSVNNRDIVHHLGDFCFGGYDNWKTILDQLKGRIILYKGNHDDSKTLKKIAKDGYFEDVHSVGNYIKMHGYQLWLTHYPMEIGIRPNKFSIHGHLHSQPSNMLNQINVGVDSLIFKHKKFGELITQDELVENMEIRNPFVENLFQEQRKGWK
ncbi:hypothetical protein [Oceanobacillus kimchii]|uniref:Metallophosphatase n=1 Tax=Oceanobacillus kimchii TaxID=746691 RepID=A0ABQ5TKW9_9BACI|nr:hypothetical protein [Oceanobacillus kimchii]GLO66283.1 metallophosphatase [Oceanobacillus kimchii]